MEKNAQEKTMKAGAVEFLRELSNKETAERRTRLAEERAKKRPLIEEASANPKRKASEELVENAPAKRPSSNVPMMSANRPYAGAEGNVPGRALEVPLFQDEERIRGFQQFAQKTLADGLQLLLDAYKEKIKGDQEKLEELLVEKERDQPLARIQSRRLEEATNRGDAAVRDREVLRRKVRSLSSMQPILAKARAELEAEKDARMQMIRAWDQDRATMREMRAEHSKEMDEVLARLRERTEENAVREDGLNKDLARARDEVLMLQRQVDELEGSRNVSPDEILRARQEGYFKGLEMNFRIFNHYGVLDLHGFTEAMEDPVKRAGAPCEEYAQQWAHLEAVPNDPAPADASSSGGQTPPVAHPAP